MVLICNLAIIINKKWTLCFYLYPLLYLCTIKTLVSVYLYSSIGQNWATILNKGSSNGLNTECWKPWLPWEWNLGKLWLLQCHHAFWIHFPKIYWLYGTREDGGGQISALFPTFLWPLHPINWQKGLTVEWWSAALEHSLQSEIPLQQWTKRKRWGSDSDACMWDRAGWEAPAVKGEFSSCLERKGPWVYTRIETSDAVFLIVHGSLYSLSPLSKITDLKVSWGGEEWFLMLLDSFWECQWEKQQETRRRSHSHCFYFIFFLCSDKG